jgi:hypothetical protein
MAPMLSEYRDVAPTGTVDFLRRLGELAEGRTMLHVNSTRYGGGVAEILHRLLPLMDELGVKTRWEVLTGTDCSTGRRRVSTTPAGHQATTHQRDVRCLHRMQPREC